jgi:hypothetical protein
LIENPCSGVVAEYPSPLFQVCKSVEEGEAIIEWSRQQGAGGLAPPFNAHVFSALIKLYLVHKASDKARALYQVSAWFGQFIPLELLALLDVRGWKREWETA